MNYYIRPIQPTETPLLKDFLYEAIFIPEGVAAPPRSILDDENLQVYIRDFGQMPADRCLVTEVGDKIVGEPMGIRASPSPFRRQTMPCVCTRKPASGFCPMMAKRP